MTDYISRETAVKIAKKYGLTTGATLEHRLGHHSGIADCIASEISLAPAADVAPVRHGHWVYKRRRSGGFRTRKGLMKNWERVNVLIDERTDTMEPFCNVCGAHNDSTNDLNMRYCPHCGAKMDEDGQGGNTMCCDYSKEVEMSEKKILDATCGARSIWFDKHHPAAVYMDKRQEFDTCIWESKDGTTKRTITVAPDIIADFTDIPFQDETFNLVVFDPPHLKQAGETAWIVKKYGKLKDDWPGMLRDGFTECMRVLRPNGVLIFKWSELQIPADQVWRAIGQKPLFGHHSGKNSKTYWGCFMKGEM